MISPVEPSQDRLFSSLYEAVMAPAGFQSFIGMLTEAFDLKAVVLTMRHIGAQEIKGVWLHGVEEIWMHRYALDYGAEDMLAQHIETAPVAAFYASNLDVPNPERFPETRFYRDWLSPQDIAYAAGAIVLKEGEWVTQLFLQRANGQQPFTRQEMSALDQLLPHLQRAIQMRQRFAEMALDQNFLAGSLDVLAMPTFLFDEFGRAVHFNRSAAGLLENATCLWLDNGYLQTPDRAVTFAIHNEIGCAVGIRPVDIRKAYGVVLLPRAGQMPLMLMVAPLPLSGRTTAQGAALLFAFDPAMRPTMTANLIRGLFGLSEAEASLTIALCSGRTLEEVALERGTSINTIKTQLKSVFLRTGTKRQADLISLVLASPAYFLTHKAPTAVA